MVHSGSLAGGLFICGIDGVAVLVLCAYKKAHKRRGSLFINHGVDLPDHSAFAHACIRKRRTAVASVVVEIIFAVALLRIGGGLQRSAFIQSEQKAAVLHRQGRRILLAKLDADPAAVAGTNQDSPRRPAMKNKIEGSRT